MVQKAEAEGGVICPIPSGLSLVSPHRFPSHSTVFAHYLSSPLLLSRFYSFGRGEHERVMIHR